MTAPAPPVLLFDGVCTLCNALVQFLIRRDGRGRLRFAALQSDAGRTLLAAHGLPPAAQPAPESVVLLAHGRAYLRSDAMLQTVRYLGWPWRALAVGRLLPRAWRDALYRYVARHRYRWFGRRAECLLPTPELRGRLL